MLWLGVEDGWCWPWSKLSEVVHRFYVTDYLTLSGVAVRTTHQNFKLMDEPSYVVGLVTTLMCSRDPWQEVSMLVPVE